MADAKAQATPEQLKVARDFEAIFLRQLLSSMEKTGGIAGSGGGAAVYRSMMVGAVADSAAESGGIGLSDMILEAMLRSQGVAAGARAPAGGAPAAAPSELSHSGAAVQKAPSSHLTPVGDLTASPTSLNLTAASEKTRLPAVLQKGGGR